MDGMLGYNQKKKKEAPPRNKFVDGTVRFFATGFYVGYVPGFPGTSGAALGVFIYSVTLLRTRSYLNPLFFFFIYGLFFLIGAFLSNLALDVYTEADHNLIVLDKMLGGMIAVSGFSLAEWDRGLGRIAIAFLIVRLWEILKIFPLKQLEKLPHGFGLMSDDVCAGIVTLLFTQIMTEKKLWEYIGLGLTALK